MLSSSTTQKRDGGLEEVKEQSNQDGNYGESVMASEVIVKMESRKNPKESDCKTDRADITAPTGSP